MAKKKSAPPAEVPAEIPNKNVLTFSQAPADRSLEAFKAWITEVGQSINPDFKDDLTPEQWEVSWKEFWAHPGLVPDKVPESK